LALRRPDGRWLALYTVPAALVHKPACQDLPATFEDLADPRYRSRLLLLAPSKSEAMRRWLGVVFTSRLSRRIPLERSLDWGAMLYVNQVDAEFTDDAELLARLAAKDSPAGEIAILPATEAVKARDADGLGVKLTFLAGAPASLEGIARVAEAPNAEAAAQFIEFAGMDEAAREAARRGRIPATRAAGLRPPPGLTLDLDVDLGDRAQLVRGLPAWMEQLERRVRLGVGELPEADDPNYWLFNVIDVVGTVTIIAVIVTLLRRGKFKALTARAEAEPQARVPGESSP
jgi:ABC-type Fe3+ transport system substrate-binding protein